MANDAIGFEVIINDNLLKKVELADEKIKQLGKTTESVSKQMITAFTQIGTQGLDALIQKVKSVQDNVSNIKIDSSNTKKSGKELIAIFEKINQIINTTTNKNGDLGLSNVGVRIEELRKQLQKAREDIDLFRHAIGTGKKTYIEFGIKGLHEAEEQAESLMRQIDALEHTKERLGKKGSIGELTGDSFEDEKQKRKIDALNDYYRELEKTSKKEADLREKALREDEKRIEKETALRKKALKEEERIAEQKAKQQSQQRKRDYNFTMQKGETYEHTMRVSNRANSINQEINAIKLLEAEKKKLKYTDEDYKKKVQQLDDALLKHKSHLQSVGVSYTNVKEKSSNLLNISDQLQRRLALVFSVSQVTGYIKKLVAVRGEFELQQRSLQAIIGNKDKANEVFDKVTKLAVQSPFQLKDLVTYTKQLAAYKIETNKLYDSTKMLADISAGVGVDMSRMVLAYGQVASANYLRGTELRQFSEAGVNILGGLAEYFTELRGSVVEVDEVFDMVSKRMVRFEHVDEVLRRMTQSGGEFYNMQAIQAQTLKGQVSNLQDSLDIMLNEIGKANEETLKYFVALTRDLVENWRMFSIILEEAGMALATVGFVKTIQTLRLTDVALQEAATSGRGIVKVVAILKRSLISLYTTITAHPIIAITSAVLAGLYALYKYNKAIDEQNKKYDENAQRLQRMLYNVRGLSEQYQNSSKSVKELNQKLKETKIGSDEYLETQKELLKAQQDQSKAILKLKSEYPELYAKIKDNIDSTDAWAKAMEELNNKTNTQIYLQQKLKGGLFQDDSETNIKQAIEAATEYELSLFNLREKAGNLAVELKLAYKEGKISLEQFNKANDVFYKFNTAKSVEELEKLKQEFFSFFSATKASERFGRADNIRFFFENAITQVNIANKKMQTALDDFGGNMENAKDIIMLEWEENKLNFNLDSENEELRKNGEKLAVEYILGVIDGFEKEDARIREYAGKKLQEWFGTKLDLGIELYTNDNQMQQWVARVKQPISDALEEMPEDIDYLKELFGDVSFQLTPPNNTEDYQEYYKKVKQWLEKIKEVINRAENDTDVLITPEEEKTLNRVKGIATEIAKILGMDFSFGKKGGKTDSMLEERLRVLREMYDAYRDLNKTLDETESKSGVIAKYGDAFNEAFKDFGISVTDYKIDVDILRENGKKSGQIFSDSMVKKIEDAVKNGTYIKSASESLKDVLKSHESSRNQLYDDATGKVIKNIDDFNNKLGTATIGVGHAVTRLSEATKYFGKTLSELEVNQIFEADVKSHENALNSVLNKYKKIVLTQEQYDVLLNKTYQGGTKSVEYAIQYATDIDKGLKHFANVKRDLSAIGKDFDKIYGNDFIERYKQASTITERLALALQTTNLYTKKGMQKNMIDGLVNRAKELSALFSGDLSISKVLEESLTPIFSQDFFVNDDKYIEALDKILDLTADAKERLKIMLEKGRVEWDIILDAKMASDAKLKETVEKMFSDYSSSIELDKMDISPEFAKAFFDIDTTSLEDLKKKLQEIQPKFTGEDMVKQYEEYLKKVEELEVKAQQERLKEYLKYTRNAIGERAKLKLEELQKLSDIEQTFKKAESDKNAQIAKLQKEKPSGYEEEIQQLQEEIKLLQSARQQAKDGLHEETETAIQKLEWEAFKSSETFASMFNDLDNVSSKALGSMIKMLERYRTEWTDLPLSEMKEVINLLDKMEEAQAQKDISANPFKFARDTKKEIKNYGGVEKAEEDMLIEQEYQLQLDEEIADLEYIIQLKNEGEELSKSVLDYETKYCVKLKEGQKSAKERLTSVKNEVKESQKREKTAKDIVKSEEELKASYQKQAEYMGDSLDMAKDLYDAFSDLYEALGGDKDSPVAIFANMGMNMAETVVNTIMLQMQLQAATIQAEAMGVAMNSAMGIVGWIVMAIQLIVEGIKAIVANHDNKLQKQIDSWAEGIEHLQKEYEKLEKVIEHAISFETYRDTFEEMQDNLQQQIKNTQAMIEAEREKKKTDDDQIKEWQEDIEEAQEQIKENMEQFYEDMGGFGSAENYKSAAEDFIDAWYSAFKETGNGLEGLKEQWDEYFDNIIKKQLLMRAGQKYIQPLLEKVDAMLDDGIMESSEMDYLRNMAEETSVGLNEILTNFAEALGEFGLGTGSELEGLSKGIQGVTEVTAQALEAILNSMRLYVIDSNKQLTEIAERVLNFENPQNPILAELKQQTEYIEEIRTFLNSVINRQGSPSIRVSM